MKKAVKLKKLKIKKSLFKEFTDFALKGNVIDLAVGVIIGASFQSIVNSMVNDVLMPLVGRVVGNIDFSNLFLILGDPAPKIADGTLDPAKMGQLDYVKQHMPVLAYGSFITAAINFVIMAFVIFLLVKGINRLKNLKLPPLFRLGEGEEGEEGESAAETAAPAAAPATKTCPYCISEIHPAATRCPHCTAVLEAPDPTPES